MGFAALSGALKSLQTFPCCAARPRASIARPAVDSKAWHRQYCIVNDQSCLHELIADDMASKRKHGEEARIALDYSAKLFLSLNYLKPGDVRPSGDGRVMYTATNETPCVLHANGANKRSLLRMLRVPRMLDSSKMWIVNGGAVMGRQLS